MPLIIKFDIINISLHFKTICFLEFLTLKEFSNTVPGDCWGLTAMSYSQPNAFNSQIIFLTKYF